MNVSIRDKTSLRASLGIARGHNLLLHEDMGRARASMLVAHMSPKDWKKNPRTGLMEPDYRWKDSQIGPIVDLDSAVLRHEEQVDNQVTNTGRVFLHTQGYSTASGQAAGLCYIGLTNTAVTPAAGDTTLSGEIAANGLTRAVGTVTLASGSGTTTTIAKTFTCATSSQAAQAAALFSASSSGTMNHELTFTQRTLQVGDTIAVTFTITLS